MHAQLQCIHAHARARAWRASQPASPHDRLRLGSDAGRQLRAGLQRHTDDAAAAALVAVAVAVVVAVVVVVVVVVVAI